MNEITIEGIVIKNVDYNDADRIVTVLNKDGIFSINAKGVKKITSKNAYSLNIFTRSSFEIFLSKAHHYSLKRGLFKESYFNLSNYEQMAVCSFMEEVTKYLVRDNQDKDVYPILLRTLESIKNGEDPLLAVLSYLDDLMSIEGLNVYSLDYLLEKDDPSFERLEPLFRFLKGKSEKAEFTKKEMVDLAILYGLYLKNHLELNLHSIDLIKII